MNKMIKKFILISMLLLPSLYVRAQYSSVLAYDTYAAERGITIVRNMSSTEVVTYVSNTETQRFTYENNSTLVYKYFELPSPTFDKIIINDIAVAYRGIRNIDVSDFTKFRIFDIDRMLNINSQEYVVPYKSYLWELAYMETAGRVVVLNDFPTPAFLSNFVYLIPYQSTAYTSVYAHDGEWLFQSLTNLDGDFFVGSGVRPFHLLLRDATASYPAGNNYSTTPALCPEDNVLKVAIIDNITPNVIYYSLPDIPILPSPHSVTDSINSAPLFIRCLSN